MAKFTIKSEKFSEFRYISMKIIDKIKCLAIKKRYNLSKIETNLGSFANFLLKNVKISDFHDKFSEFREKRDNFLRFVKLSKISENS